MKFFSPCSLTVYALAAVQGLHSGNTALVAVAGIGAAGTLGLGLAEMVQDYRKMKAYDADLDYALREPTVHSNKSDEVRTASRVRSPVH